MPKCDICGEEFDTERGLHIHQSQKHEEEAEDVETEEEAAEEDSGEESEEVETPSQDEVVREIEEDTSGGLLGGFSRESIFVGGAFVGIALGLIVGLFLSQGGAGFDKASPSEVQSQIESIPNLGISVESVNMENGLYLVNATRTATLGNQTIDQPLSLYVSPDGELLFPQGVTFEQLRQQAQQQQQQPPQPPTGDDTSTQESEATGNETQ
jgi:hypothetical protein